MQDQIASAQSIAPYHQMDLATARRCVAHDLAAVRRAAQFAPYPHIKAKREANAAELERIAAEIAARMAGQ